MDTVLSVLSSVFWGLLMLSVLVFLHEGGHFIFLYATFWRRVPAVSA